MKKIQEADITLAEHGFPWNLLAGKGCFGDMETWEYLPILSIQEKPKCSSISFRCDSCSHTKELEIRNEKSVISMTVSPSLVILYLQPIPRLCKARLFKVFFMFMYFHGISS